MPEIPGTLEGWYALHDFRRLDWERWKALSPAEREAVVAEATAYLAAAEKATDTGEGSSALYRILGHKADFMFLHLRPRIDDLSALETAFNRTRLAGLMTRPYSYVSVTELSQHEAGARGGTDGGNPMDNPFVRQRLYPPVPDMRYMVFYPMSKRRGETVNWYALEQEERRRMMREHGRTGSKYAGKVVQMITGSTGLDDWEWGVTLFSDDPLQFKKLVYEMRFDEVSARYGEFGPFFLGIRVPAAELGNALGG